MKSILNRYVVGLNMILIAVIGCEQSDAPATGAPALGERARIVGGVETGYAEWQGVLSLEILSPNGVVECTGVLIHPDLLLTAAHCVWDDDIGVHIDEYPTAPEAILVKNGSKIELSDFGVLDGGIAPPGLLTTAARIIYHPDWTGTLTTTSADLAMILLNDTQDELPFYSLRTAPLPQEGSAGKVVGYGEDENGVSDVHRQGDTTILAVTDHTFETGQPSNTCTGDSGAPLFTFQNDEWVVTGIASFGKSYICSTEGDSFSINLLSYREWITQTASALTDSAFDGNGDTMTASANGCRMAPAPVNHSGAPLFLALFCF